MRLRSFLGCLLLAFAPLISAQDSAFQYIGTLSDTQQPAPTGSFDFQVTLYDGSGVGAVLLAPAQVLSAVPVQAGYFTLNLDFGSAVLAPQAWLQIGVRPAGSGNFDTLSPRQKIGHVPLAYYTENADWSGISNVPSALVQLAARPAGIGNLIANSSGDIANLRVRAIQFGISRNCIPTCGPTTFEEAELLVEPGKDWWKLYKWANTGEGGEPSIANNISLAIHLDATGGLAANPFADLQGAVVTRVKYESGTGAGDQDLVRVGITYPKITLTVGSTGVTYSYDRSILQGSSVPAICLDFFSVMAAGVPVTGEPNSTLFIPDPPNPIDVNHPSGSGADYVVPNLTLPLDPAAPNRWARAATCALALVTTYTALAPNPTLTFNTDASARPDNYSQRITWKAAKMAGWRVESNAQGVLLASFSMFAPCVGLSVNQGQPDSFLGIGWNYSSNLPCAP